MSDNAELNRRLAEALGWKMGKYGAWCSAAAGGPVVHADYFRPAEDSNHLRMYVLPEIVKGGLPTLRKFQMEVVATRPCPSGLDLATWFLVQPPAILAAAALKVLGGEG